jgi:transposase
MLRETERKMTEVRKNFHRKAWLNGFHRLPKDYEKLTETGETMIIIAFTRLMLNNKIFD